MSDTWKPFNLLLAEKVIASKRHRLPDAMQAEAVAEIKRLREINAELMAALRLTIPANLCLTNRNVRDDTIVPLEATMGDLRKIAAAIAKAVTA